MFHITNSSSFSVALGTADVKPALRLVAAIVFFFVLFFETIFFLIRDVAEE